MSAPDVGMKVGVVGSFGSATQVVEMAVAAEEHGWDGFFSWDGISVMAVDTFDPWAMLAAAAVRTERVTLGAMVFALPRRRPWEVARQALTVDHLSGGRLVLPVGVGVLDDGGFSAVPDQPQELRARAEQLDDALAFLDRAWTGEPFAFAGTRLKTGEMQFLPRPVDRPGTGHRVPVWPVGVWDAARPPRRSLDRALRADGTVLQLRGERGFDVPTPDDVSALVSWLTARRAELGLPADRPFDVVLQGELPADRAAATEQLADLAEAGATWWVESRWNPDTATPTALLDTIRQGPPRP
ncbi:LLM class flavin-dependent oxidoreductase [Cellulosimicrobium marinum]|uniref:LLM class flavin-dependent oxidoreductase n=1 Tax=Cellulosimicrobium marinum TaxID=1638992 RepID=UPI001E5177CA|nr:LLM class flavin-dependent oxidoreductase [Cellulosimicrobium marinum]MCB7137916.1 LLM class flavin-dependent oxidoreductase [Cellulosimicrobium marinum]